MKPKQFMPPRGYSDDEWARVAVLIGDVGNVLVVDNEEVFTFKELLSDEQRSGFSSVFRQSALDDFRRYIETSMTFASLVSHGNEVMGRAEFALRRLRVNIADRAEALAESLRDLEQWETARGVVPQHTELLSNLAEVAVDARSWLASRSAGRGKGEHTTPEDRDRFWFQLLVVWHHVLGRPVSGRGSKIAEFIEVAGARFNPSHEQIKNFLKRARPVLDETKPLNLILDFDPTKNGWKRSPYASDLLRLERDAD